MTKAQWTILISLAFKADDRQLSSRMKLMEILVMIVRQFLKRASRNSIQDEMSFQNQPVQEEQALFAYLLSRSIVEAQKHTS